MMNPVLVTSRISEILVKMIAWKGF